MNMNPRVKLLLACVFSLWETASAQPQLWEVYSISDQPFVNVTIDRFDADSLYMKSMTQVLALHQDSIKYVVRRNESKFGLGFLFGAVVGGIMMGRTSDGHGLFPDMAHGTSIALGVAIGGALGGAVGLGAGTDTKYQIQKLDSEEKRKVLSRLFPSKAASE